MPLLVRYPKLISPGSVHDSIIENVDFAPTLLEIAGAEIPASVQGASFKGMLETGQEPDEWKQAAYYRYWMHMAHHDNPAHLGLRTKTHKLIYYYGCNYDGGYRTPPGWELYDLRVDPQETRNVYAEAANAEVVKDLKQRLATLRQQVGDDGSHHPACEEVVQEFWEFDEQSQVKAAKISADYLQRRQVELQNDQRNTRTWSGE